MSFSKCANNKVGGIFQRGPNRVYNMYNNVDVGGGKENFTKK